MRDDAAPAARARPGGQVRQGPIPQLPRPAVERWLLSSKLAVRRDDGQLELTPKGFRIAGSLTRLGD